jgi:hypothetical protein
VSAHKPAAQRLTHRLCTNPAVDAVSIVGRVVFRLIDERKGEAASEDAGSSARVSGGFVALGLDIRGCGCGSRSS